MTVLAALAIGLCCALVVASLMGTMPRLPRFRPRRRFSVRQLGASVLVGLFVLLLGTALTGSAFIALVPAIAIGFVPRSYAARQRRLRVREIQAAWPDGLRDVSASIAAGKSLTQACNALAADGPPPLRRAFARFPGLARVIGTGPALEIVKEELADPTSDRVLEVLVLAHERGGPILRQILQDLVTATTRDIKLLDALHTEGLEMRINARAVVVMPWLVLVALTARPGPFRDFYRSSGGVVTLSLAALMTAIGLVALRRLGREPAETRVFAR